MRLTFVLFLMCFCLHVSAQEKNSLLWEISGNGLQETSYLYGTMHVSKKIAFRLDDVFYEALDKSQMVALESDPGTWLENDQDIGNIGYGLGNSFATKGFYTHPFAMQQPRKEDLAVFLAFEDGLINNILYRTNEYSQNFEEETYLDMFIYQAGSKLGKPIIALEELEESTALVGRASLNAVKQKPDEWLQKKMQRQDLMFLMQDAYRERNINLLDSIDRAMYTDHYLKNMLYVRNENMTKRLDSVIRKGKVFSGIGAAHLPGKHGVIALLRNRGYTVEPLVSKATSKGLRLKEKFESKIRVNTYKTYGPDDDFFSIALPNKLYPVSEYVNTTYISPDLANGSYLIVYRIPTFSFLRKVKYTITDIDRLLFENIPGKILEKTKIKKNGFAGLDIKNRLKNGDHQRYQIYVTPLEIFIFKMGGEGNYVAMYSDTIFNSLKFRQLNKKKLKLSSGYRDFEIQMPPLYTFGNRFRSGSRFLEGYDSINDSYYFLRKATLNDFNFIEADTFELKQIQKRFYQGLKLKPVYDEYTGSSLISRAVFDSTNHKSLYLKTAFRRGDYYLMGMLTKNDHDSITFFESFKIKEPSYPTEFKKVRDTALFFTTVSSVKPPKFVESSNTYYRGRQQPKSYSPYTKKTVYQNKNDEAITVELTKSHDYLTFPNIDSVWALRKKQYAHKKFTIIREETRALAKDHHELMLTLTDTASTRGIIIKNIVKGGLLYELKASVDTIYQPSRFVSEFFDNFKPQDTLIGRSILEDKTADFFAALKANDSIVITGYRFLIFDEKHIDSLKQYITKFNFATVDKKYIQSHLIQKLGQIDKPEVLTFFEEFYVKSYNNSSAQTKILQAISKKKDANSVTLLLDLLSKDLPLVSNTFEIQKIFKPYRDSLELAKKLYPELLDYSTIGEYKSPVFSLLARLKSKGFIKANLYKKYRKQLLNDAKIQLKRHLGTYNSPKLQRRYSKTYSHNNSVLEDYVVLLHPFAHEKDMKQFFQRLSMVKDPKIRTTYVSLMAATNMTLPKGVLDSLSSDITSRAMLFNKLQNIGKSYLFPLAYKSQRFLAETVLFENKKFDKKQDSIQFLEQRSLKYRGKSYIGYYFKVKNNQSYDKNFRMHLVVYKAEGKLTTKPFYKNDGLRIEDTDTDKEVMGYVTEKFLLKDRQRAMVYKPDHYAGYGRYGY